ncbi:aminomethyl-transferring glycine dehydrogenase subunit GcvPA [Candidatus Bathyarchaeota archaeon A05DMB-4]|jgi:glycine dehydrogenase subunit 1|nr:aminomethyl-transferring glycine dehydrogenase subunit GcvPA [Candidatus Bathyarchaeota archaeon A05DMB-4]
MKELGIQNIDELYRDIPEKFRLKQKLNIPKGSSEAEVKRHVENLLAKNKTSATMPTFLGAGCWPHYVPAVVENIILRSELLTAYTPYQPEISQGMLQALFEYQSMICELTGMEVANCSMYDWASAVGEAARMVARITKRSEILVPKIIHPERNATLQTYVEPAEVQVKHVNYDKSTGQLDLEDLKTKISTQTAAVYVENPSYLGFIETEAEAVAQIAHDKGALFIVGVDPVSLGIIKPPGEYGADIVVGEGQPLGIAMNFGGPLLGIFACRGDMELIRQMPGRTIGITTTLDGTKRGFCMALQTREQHIRREKATSNICSNEALCAVASAVYLALLGPQGLKELGETCMIKADYAIKKLSKIEGVKTPIFDAPHFKEFTVNFDDTGKSVQHVHEDLLLYGVHGGKDVSKEFPELGGTALYCVTEVHSKHDIDRLATALEEVLKER